MEFPCTVTVTEITGSESFVHLMHGTDRWVGLVHGVHDLAPGTEVSVWLDPAHVYVFGAGWRIGGARRLCAGGLRGTGWHGSRCRSSRIPTFPIRSGEQDFALKEMDHVWDDGGAYALLGLVGLRQDHASEHHLGAGASQSQGRVLFGERDVTNAPTTERNIAQVFQFPVVYDTMTVRDNLAFPLRNRGMDAAYIAARVDADRADDRHGGRRWAARRAA